IDVVIVGADRDLGFDQSSWLGPAVSPALLGGFHRCEETVDAAGADGFETFAQRIADPTMAPLVVRQPDCDHRFEKFAAGLVGRQPDHLENLSFGSAVYGLATSGFDPADGGAHWPVHELDRVFAVQSAYLNQLVEQLG